MDPDLVKSMNSTTSDDPTAGNACWETPPNVFDALHNEFKFDVDLTGGPGTQHRMSFWLGPGSPYPNALNAPWHSLRINGKEIRSGFSNPPYGRFIPLVLFKALIEAEAGFTSVFLLPNRITQWYKNMMRRADEIRIIDERIAFWENGHPRWNAKILREEGRFVPDNAMFDSCLVIIRPNKRRAVFFPRASFDIWHWEKERNAKCRLSIPL